jgi:hypothetical protein
MGNLHYQPPNRNRNGWLRHDPRHPAMAQEKHVDGTWTIVEGLSYSEEAKTTPPTKNLEPNSKKYMTLGYQQWPDSTLSEEATSTSSKFKSFDVCCGQQATGASALLLLATWQRMNHPIRSRDLKRRGKPARKPSLSVAERWLSEREMGLYFLGTSLSKGIEPTALVPSGFSISSHHFAPSGRGLGAMAWMS